jgi:hypothetical protein
MIAAASVGSATPPEQNHARKPVDHQGARDFLNGLERGGVFHFRAVDDNVLRAKRADELRVKRGRHLLTPEECHLIDENESLTHEWYGTYGQVSRDLAEYNARGAAAYVMINRTSHGKWKNKNDDVDHVRAYVIDFDIPSEEQIEDLPEGLRPLFRLPPIERLKQLIADTAMPPPAMINESSPGKFHAWWPTSGGSPHNFTFAQLTLAARYGGDPAISDRVRIMRIPGYDHNKNAPYRSHAWRPYIDVRYDDADLIERIGKMEPPPENFRGKTKSKSTKDAGGSYGDKTYNNKGSYNSADGWREINEAALARTDAWVPELFPNAEPYQGGYRVPSAALGRDLQEDLGIHPSGIYDHGEEKGYTAIDLVAKHLAGCERPHDAMVWLCKQLGMEAPRPKGSKQDAADIAMERFGRPNLLQSSAEFVAGFVPPDYLIDGLLQRRSVYSLTAGTGTGKTAVALRMVAHVALGLELADLEVEKGRCLFFAGENPDDVRSRWIKLCEELEQGPADMDVYFLPGTPPISTDKIRERINAEAAKHGPFNLLVVDTSAAYFTGDDENSNTQLGAHARMLRSLVDLPGGPTVLVTCHPTKSPNPDNLLPRGGGAFIAEVDGNLVLLKEPGSMVVEMTTHGKFRGPEFKPFAFKIVPGTSDKLIDSKGRKIWTVTAVPISAADQSAMEDAGKARQDELLQAMKAAPGASLATLADALGWRDQNGDPYKMLVHRMMRKLCDAKLAKKQGEHFVLTPLGAKTATVASVI